MRLSALGDVAMTIPAIYSAATTYPQHTFHVLTSAFCAQLFINPPDNIVMHPVKDKAVRHILRDLKPLHIDAVADLHNVLRSWRIDLHYLLRGKRVSMVDKRRGERHAITHDHKTAYKPFTMRYFDTMRVSPTLPGGKADSAFKGLFPDGDAPLPNGMTKKPGTRWIGIAPFARYKNKTYPLDKMREVVAQLLEHDNTEVFLFGAKGKETDLFHEWAEAMPGATRAWLHTPPYMIASDGTSAHAGGLFTEIALMSHLDTMVTMDSANMHLASLVGTRVVSVWGSTTPACGFLGWGQSEADAIVASSPTFGGWKGEACQPCTIAGSETCRFGDFHCLTAINPERIVDKVLMTTKADSTAG